MGATGRARVLQVASLIVALAFLNRSVFAGELVTDETLSLRVLRLTFPNARISILPAKHEVKPYSVRDPLGRVIKFAKNWPASGHEYEIAGPVEENEEEPASDVTDPMRSPSEQRRVLLQLSRWRIADAEPLLLGVLTYSFINADPPRCCRTFGRILLFSTTGDRILDSLAKVPYAFTRFTSVEFFHMDGTATEKVVIGGDFSGVSTVGVNSVVLDVVQQRLKPLMSVTTMVLYEAELESADVHTLTLDSRRTRVAGGKRFFLVKKSFVEKGKVLRKPVTSSVSYPIGTGLPLDWQ